MAERFHREIEEILEQTEEPDQVRKPQRKGRDSSRGSGNRFEQIRQAVTAGRLFLVSGSLLLSALILNVIGGGLVNVLFWMGLVLFIFAYAIFFVRSGTQLERRWRGRVVDYGGRPSWLDKARGWLR